jgi:hypothetical protein
VFVGVASQYGGRATEVENMSEAIAWCGAAYVIAAVSVIVAIGLRARGSAQAVGDGASPDNGGGRG